jgi:hypothetical protein
MAPSLKVIVNHQKISREVIAKGLPKEIKTRKTIPKPSQILNYQPTQREITFINRF